MAARLAAAHGMPRSELEAGWATKDQVHDEALGWFLQQHAHHPVQDYPARRAGDADLTFWLDSRVLERARRMARARWRQSRAR